MKIESFITAVGAKFFSGVPDSLLKPLCDWLITHFGTSDHHIIAANEGNAVALATGYYLSTGEIPAVYLQNSGIGNIINPLASLLNEKIYAIPCVFIVGWRGEPGTQDEPQHLFQGEVTLRLLEDMGVETHIISENTQAGDISQIMQEYRKHTAPLGKSIAFVVKKDALTHSEPVDYQNAYFMRREEIMRHIIKASENDIIVTTTGKTSRELFELRETLGQGHERDFLTVGSMGHSSSIALGIALSKPDKRVWCIDGDGAVLMHLGAMAVIGSRNPLNMIHILVNNGAHESVGGQPTAMVAVDAAGIAKSCGYTHVACVDTFEALDTQLRLVRENQVLTFLEIKSAIGSRSDLGRPSISAKDNKLAFMNHLS